MEHCLHGGQQIEHSPALNQPESSIFTSGMVLIYRVFDINHAYNHLVEKKTNQKGCKGNVYSIHSSQFQNTNIHEYGGAILTHVKEFIQCTKIHDATLPTIVSPLLPGPK